MYQPWQLYLVYMHVHYAEHFSNVILRSCHGHVALLYLSRFGRYEAPSVL